MREISSKLFILTQGYITNHMVRIMNSNLYILLSVCLAAYEILINLIGHNFIQILFQIALSC